MNGWLVLTRHVGESIKIGDDIEVSVGGVDGGEVKLAIRAPRDVVILRHEVAERVAEMPAPDNGACPHCDGTDVKRPDPLADSFRCNGCRASWYGVRRRLAA